MNVDPEYMQRREMERLEREAYIRHLARENRTMQGHILFLVGVLLLVVALR